ncbi:MAG: O-acetylhomoserine aminocarboxypropyltransferase/cysteine synthase [Tissierellia bacterium]|nr:O-acetylhomoserine aminocarboxypropyltransferase/cysteine synthase [Tissierellia bacterium]
MEEKMSYIETQCVQAGYEPNSGDTRIAPIAQSTTYYYEQAGDVAQLFDLEKEGHMYSRISNPSVEVLEKKIAILEGGVGALGVSSGQSASLLAVLTITDAGDHIIAMNNLYGGTFTLLSSTLKRLGIESTFLSPDASEEEISRSVRDNTKLIFGETIGNPLVDVLDIERIATIAHQHDLPLIVDNTLATPILCRPIEWGADIVVHSATKYLDGHATSLGGLIVDSGKFDWTKSSRHPQLVEPDPTYHGLSYSETFGPAAFIVRARAAFLRDFGTTLSPFNAFLINLGTETLHLRMERHSSNALKMAQYLEKHPNVEWVAYPGLENSPTKPLADKYLSGGSGIIAFGVKGGAKEAVEFIDKLKLASMVVHLGDLRTHVLHPSSMTHRQLSQEQQLASGITPNLIRLSVGIENVSDIIADIQQALE